MRSGQVSLTTMKLVLASHVAGPVVAVLGTVAKPLFEASVVRAGVIALTRIVVRVNGERLLAALLRRNTEPSGGTLPVASWTGCKHRCDDIEHKRRLSCKASDMRIWPDLTWGISIGVRGGRVRR